MLRLQLIVAVLVCVGVESASAQAVGLAGRLRGEEGKGAISLRDRWEQAATDQRAGPQPKPTDAALGYHFFAGRPVSRGISANDVTQGMLGDCYLAGGLAGMALHEPGQRLLRDAIVENADGTFTVGFPGLPPGQRQITIDASLPYTTTFSRRAGPDQRIGRREYARHEDHEIPFEEVDTDGDRRLSLEEYGREYPEQVLPTPAYMGFGSEPDDDHGREWWPALIEKAFAKARGGYANIESSNPALFWEALTGKQAYQIRLKGGGTAEQLDGLLRKAYRNKLPVAFGSFNPKYHRLPANVYRQEAYDTQARHKHRSYRGSTGELVEGHAYFLSGARARDGRYPVGNPWGREYDLRFTPGEILRGYNTLFIGKY